mmetsp:Transcript_28925/g.69539  ORF Transcript_28925/g.69539 Transcript_28925/m.69539 type:complete len:209 (+) Transcript_28925:560-1186(+)
MISSICRSISPIAATSGTRSSTSKPGTTLPNSSEILINLSCQLTVPQRFAKSPTQGCRDCEITSSITGIPRCLESQFHNTGPCCSRTGSRYPSRPLTRRCRLSSFELPSANAWAGSGCRHRKAQRAWYRLGLARVSTFGGVRRYRLAARRRLRRIHLAGQGGSAVGRRGRVTTVDLLVALPLDLGSFFSTQFFLRVCRGSAPQSSVRM